MTPTTCSHAEYDGGSPPPFQFHREQLIVDVGACRSDASGGKTFPSCEFVTLLALEECHEGSGV